MKKEEETNKSPLQVLAAEHAIARDVVALLVFFDQELRSEKNTSFLALKDFFEAAYKFLEAHHAKEMEALACLAECNEAKREDLVAVLSGEHQLGYDLLGHVLGIIKSEDRTKKERYEILPKYIRKYKSNLKEHIKKEERIFFPLLEKNLSESHREYLDEAFKKIDKKFFIRKPIGIINRNKAFYLKTKSA